MAAFLDAVDYHLIAPPYGSEKQFFGQGVLVIDQPAKISNIRNIAYTIDTICAPSYMRSMKRIETFRQPGAAG